jgi:hypothetical protein
MPEQAEGRGRHRRFVTARLPRMVVHIRPSSSLFDRLIERFRSGDCCQCLQLVTISGSQLGFVGHYIGPKFSETHGKGLVVPERAWRGECPPAGVGCALSAGWRSSRPGRSGRMAGRSMRIALNRGIMSSRLRLKDFGGRGNIYRSSPPGAPAGPVLVRVRAHFPREARSSGAGMKSRGDDGASPVGLGSALAGAEGRSVTLALDAAARSAPRVPAALILACGPMARCCSGLSVSALGPCSRCRGRRLRGRFPPMPAMLVWRMANALLDGTRRLYGWREGLRSFPRTYCSRSSIAMIGGAAGGGGPMTGLCPAGGSGRLPWGPRPRPRLPDAFCPRMKAGRLHCCLRSPCLSGRAHGCAGAGSHYGFLPGLGIAFGRCVSVAREPA